jgi:predicted NBD/HSP70 family sugar kinase
LALAVGLTKSTVSLLVRELLAEGWLIEHEVVATGELGRRPTPLFIDPSRLLLLGAEVGVAEIRVVATTLTGVVLARKDLSFGAAMSLTGCVASLSAAVQELHQELAGDDRRILGMGVGLPGGVDEASGVLRFSPNLGWHDVPFGALLAEQLRGTPLAGVPLYVQNEADVAALGELEFTVARQADPLLYLSINQGVGAGVIVGERLLTGARGFAGEVGHMVLEWAGPRCTCGRQGCAEALISPRAMLGDSGPLPGPASGSPVGELLRRLDAGDAATAKAVNKAGKYLGVLLQNLATAYDPACIVVGGSCLQLGDALLQPALETLRTYAAAAQLEPPVVQISSFGADAVAVGAAALARYRLTRPLIAPGAQHNNLPKGT